MDGPHRTGAMELDQPTIPGVTMSLITARYS